MRFIMPDVYTPIPDDSYMIGIPFYKPTQDGSKWAIALPSKGGSILTAAISVTLTIIFMRLWKIVCFVALACSGQPTINRRAALATLWNSHDPFIAFRKLAAYSLHYFGRSWPDFTYGFTFCVLSFVIYGGGLALGIVGPSHLDIGDVAPVRPSVLYYPERPSPANYGAQLQRNTLLAAESLRALGGVEGAKSSLRRRVNITTKWLYDDDIPVDMNVPDGEDFAQLSYEYNLTGVDFGLQHGPKLLLRVRGSCKTEYSWIVPNISQSRDVYNLWGNANVSEGVQLNNQSIRVAPKLLFWMHPDSKKQYRNDGNTSFAIVITSAHRASIRVGSDPWYKTELRDLGKLAPHEAYFWIKRSRPVLSCWQKDEWSHGHHQIKNVYELGSIPDIKVEDVLLKLLKTVFEVPVLYTLVTSIGSAALKPGTKGAFADEGEVIDAGASRLTSDMERLLLASYIKSKNAFVDTTMFEEQGTLRNVMGSTRAEPLPGVGDFVISSIKVQTFSLVGLLILVAVLMALLAAEVSITLFLHFHRPKESHQEPILQGFQGAPPGNDATDAGGAPLSPTQSKIMLFKELSTSQLFHQLHSTKENRLNGKQT